MAKEYIEREAAVMKIREWFWSATGVHPKLDRDAAEEIMFAIPTADVRTVRHGRWIWNKDGMDWGIGAWECSNCHATPQTFWNTMQNIRPLNMASSSFCPDCGARMDGDRE